MESPQQKPTQIDDKKAQKPNEQGRILVQDHFVIRDRNTTEVIVKGRG